MSYILARFSATTPEINEMLTALLSEAGFEGFEETDDGLLAYVSESHFSGPLLKESAALLGCSYQLSEIEARNWNNEWESSFQPVKAGSFCGIRAHFHERMEGVEHEIVITPKMSFGTGHHATTMMMLQHMSELNLTGHSVLDFGTGTGVLAILAEKMGADSITAIDNDEWSILNTKENIERNECSRINVLQAGSPDPAGTYDCILANITLNVILEHLESLSEQLKDGGRMIVSGILQENEMQLKAVAGVLDLDHELTKHEGAWISMRFVKQDFFRE